MSIIAKLLIAAAFAIRLAQCAVAAPAAPVRVASLTWSGNGCPSGQATFETGRGTIVAKITNFDAEIGPSISPLEKTKNCAAHLNLSGGIPGWRLALTEVTSEGMWVIGPNTTLTTFVTVFWSADAANTYSGRQDHHADNAAKTPQKFSFRTAISTDLASQCIEDRISGILNFNWRAAFTSTSSEGYGSLVATEENPLYITMKFAYVACD